MGRGLSRWLVLPGQTLRAMTGWVASRMWCVCGKRWASVAPIQAFLYECPGCGAMGPAPVWGTMDDLELELSGVRLN